jgi:hypothetical protein
MTTGNQKPVHSRINGVRHHQLDSLAGLSGHVRRKGRKTDKDGHDL